MTTFRVHYTLNYNGRVLKQCRVISAKNPDAAKAAIRLSVGDYVPIFSKIKALPGVSA